MGRKEKKEISKGMKIFRRVMLVILILFVILLGVTAGVGIWYVNDKLGKVNYVEITADDIEVTEGIEEKLDGYRTIAIFGVDSRSNNMDEGARSDCIILATLNEETKEVQLTSIYRDTYMQLTGRSLDKITHAYSYGGPALALSTLNTNLDLNITEFVTVNFDAVVDIVDAVGGVSMNITSAELNYINGYVDEINRVTKHNASHVTKTGNQTLNGVQALAYSRIRYTSGGDYKRTERMRDVLMAVVNKAKKMSITKLNSLADKLLPKVYTNIEGGEIISLLPQLVGFNITDSKGWPNNTKGATINGVWYGIPVTLESSVKELHKEVYGEENYEVSEKVKEISNKIVKKTGYK